MIKISNRAVLVAAMSVLLAAGAGSLLAQSEDEGGDEQMARRLGGSLGKLAFVADSFSKVEEGESVAIDRAMEILDQIGAIAGEIEHGYEKKGDAAGQRKARALDHSATAAEAELRDYASDKSTPKLCGRALHEVIDDGNAVVEHLLDT